MVSETAGEHPEVKFIESRKCGLWLSRYLLWRVYHISVVGMENYSTLYSETGRRALELVLAIYRSAQTGQPVRLPLEDCATIDFRGRFS